MCPRNFSEISKKQLVEIGVSIKEMIRLIDLIIFILLVIVVMSRQSFENWKNESIRHGFAEYILIDGNFEWVLKDLKTFQETCKRERESR